jgi:hypothetical protein
VHQQDGRAVVAGLLQERLRGLRVGLDQHLAALVGGEGGAADEHGGAGLVVLRVADDGVEEVLLLHRQQRRAPDLGFVERRVQAVEAEHVLVAERVLVEQDDVLVRLHDRQQVVGRLLDQVDLAVLEGAHRGLLVGDRDPLDPVDLHHLAARAPGRRLAPRLVVGELLVDRDRRRASTRRS